MTYTLHITGTSDGIDTTRQDWQFEDHDSRAYAELCIRDAYASFGLQVLSIKMLYTATYADGSIHSVGDPVAMVHYMEQREEQDGSRWTAITGPDVDGMDVVDWFRAMTMEEE